MFWNWISLEGMQTEEEMKPEKRAFSFSPKSGVIWWVRVATPHRSLRGDYERLTTAVGDRNDGAESTEKAAIYYFSQTGQWKHHSGRDEWKCERSDNRGQKTVSTQKHYHSGSVCLIKRVCAAVGQICILNLINILLKQCFSASKKIGLCVFVEVVSHWGFYLALTDECHWCYWPASLALYF